MLTYSVGYGYIVTMYLRTTTRTYKGKTYTNHLLVESVHTSKGPRQKVICSLGDLKPRPKDEWLKLARKVEARLSGQEPLFDEPDREAEAIARKVKEKRAATAEPLGGRKKRRRRSSAKQDGRSRGRPAR